MPYATEHQAPLALVTGPDGRLGVFTVLTSLAGCVAIASSPAVPWLRLELGVVLLPWVARAWREHFRKGIARRLLVYSHGLCRYDGAIACIERHAWLGPGYAVLGLRQGTKRHRVLISAGRQGPDSIRLLRCWLRQNRFNEDVN